jgi:hypothetical protein
MKWVGGTAPVSGAGHQLVLNYGFSLGHKGVLLPLAALEREALYPCIEGLRCLGLML